MCQQRCVWLNNTAVLPHAGFDPSKLRHLDEMATPRGGKALENMAEYLALYNRTFSYEEVCNEHKGVRRGWVRG